MFSFAPGDTCKGQDFFVVAKVDADAGARLLPAEDLAAAFVATFGADGLCDLAGDRPGETAATFWPDFALETLFATGAEALDFEFFTTGAAFAVLEPFDGAELAAVLVDARFCWLFATAFDCFCECDFRLSLQAAFDCGLR